MSFRAMASVNPTDAASTCPLEDRRAQDRATMVTRGHVIDLAGESRVDVVVADISLKGIGLHSAYSLPVGSRWKLHLTAGPIALNATIEIVNTRHRSDTHIAGARFV